MKWSKWPYWVRGGILLSVAYILITGLLYLGTKCPNAPNPCEQGLFGLGILLIISPMVFLLEIIPIPLERMPPAIEFLIFILLQIAMYFALGSVLGWLYGKIKGRKTSTLNPTP